MIKIKVEDIKKGMILGAPVLNDTKTTVLLNEGTELTERHINLLENLGIHYIKVLEESEQSPLNDLEKSLQEELLVAKAKALKAGENFDEIQYKEKLTSEYNEQVKILLDGVIKSNEKIQILTGEGNIPFDIKNAIFVDESKEIFGKIKDGDKIELDNIKEHLETAFPDMIRNNDILMRLKQLQETDDYTFQHSIRVSLLASMIGKWLKYSENEMKELALAGLLFDIGKLKVPDFVMNRERKITSNEYNLIKKHPQFGYQILLKTEGVTNNVKYCALQHHERMDGSGYPLRVKERQIHEFAKIIMVCDIYDAMISDRPYRRRYSAFDAAEYIEWNSGVTLDARICYIFLTNLAEYYTGKRVLLNTGKMGTIIYVDMEYPTRPIIKLDDGQIVELTKNKHIRVLDMA